MPLAIQLKQLMAKKNGSKANNSFTQSSQQRGQAVDSPQSGGNSLQVLQATRRSGPLPVPQDFEHYDRVVPGAAERILRMAESELEHRHELEKNELLSEDQSSRRIHRALARGQYTGWALSIICVLLAAGVAVYGVHWLVSAALVGIPILVAARALISGAGGRS